MTTPADHFRDTIAEHISESGQFMFGVFSTEVSPAFTYTIGLTEVGLSELVITGFSPDNTVAGILNRVGEILRERGTDFTHGEIVPLFPNSEKGVKLLQVSEEKRLEYAVQVGQYYHNDDFKLMQVVLPDEDGVWPENGAAYPYSVQILLSNVPSMLQ